MDCASLVIIEKGSGPGLERPVWPASPTKGCASTTLIQSDPETLSDLRERVLRHLDKTSARNDDNRKIVYRLPCQEVLAMPAHLRIWSAALDWVRKAKGERVLELVVTGQPQVSRQHLLFELIGDLAASAPEVDVRLKFEPAKPLPAWEAVGARAVPTAA